MLRQSHEQVFADGLLPQVLLGIEQAATTKGFQVLLKPLEPEDCDGYLHLVQENHVDGIILSGPRQNEAELIRLAPNRAAGHAHGSTARKQASHSWTSMLWMVQREP